MKLKIILVGAMFACVSLLSAGTESAEPPLNSLFKLTPEQRYYWINGAMLSISHLVATRDKAKGDCVAKWYLQDKQGKQAKIEAMLSQHPAETPTTIILTLLTQACGDLLGGPKLTVY